MAVSKIFGNRIWFVVIFICFLHYFTDVEGKPLQISNTTDKDLDLNSNLEDHNSTLDQTHVPLDPTLVKGESNDGLEIETSGTIFWPLGLEVWPYGWSRYGYGGYGRGYYGGYGSGWGRGWKRNRLGFGYGYGRPWSWSRWH